jgi:hypothetical protein
MPLELSIPIRRAINSYIGSGDGIASINPGNGGVIPVTILTTDDFDASIIRQSALRFGKTARRAVCGGAPRTTPTRMVAWTLFASSRRR